MARYVTGIDAGDYAIKVCVAEIRSDRNYPRLLAVVKKESRGFRRGHVSDPEEAREAIGEALRAAEKQSGIKIRKAYVSIDGQTLTSQLVDGSTIVSRADSEITEYDIKRTVEAAGNKISDLSNREVLDIIPLYFKVDGKKVLKRPIGMKGGKLEVRFLFVTCLLHHVDDLYQVIEQNHVSIEKLIPAPVAASFVTLNKTQKIAGCILADIGAGTTKIAVFEEGLLLSTESFDVGSQDVTNDIALGLKVPLEDAETIKIERVSRQFTDKHLAEIVEARLTDIFELIENHLKKLGKNELLPAGIIIVGGGAFISKIDLLASAALNLPGKVTAQLFPQNARLEGVRADDAGRIYLKDPTFAACYGLVAYGQNPKKGIGLEGRNSLATPIMGSVARWFKTFLP
jgi:cell division protein FtsA